MLFKLCKEDGSLHVLGGSGAEIVNGTIIDAVLCEGAFDRRSALLVFVHYKEVSFRQALDESPKVGITRHNDKRCDAVTVEVRDNTRCHSHIDQGLSVGHTVDLDMFNGYLCEFGEPVPACGSVRIVIERDFLDLGKFFLI